MIKRTRMIVVTKEKIVKFGVLFGIMFISIILCNFIVKKVSIPTFSGYETIINNEIVPANDYLKKENVKEKKDRSISTGILKKFFVLGEYEKKQNEEIISEDNQDKETENVLTSESVTIDRGITVSNNTKYNINPQDYIEKPLSFNANGSGPQVLIMHTHTTESFSEEAYVKGAPDRNLDEAKNITAVGKAMERVFGENGIGVIHDKTVHDYPSYNSAYQSAAATIQKNLNENKSIKVVLDVHRDGITREDGTKVKLVTDVNGEKTAQIMLVVGTDTNLPHEKWQENFKFASKIQAKGVEMYPSLMRPIDLRKERFNEQLTTGSIIIEVGSNGNTMDEAIRGGERIAEIISAVLKEG